MKKRELTKNAFFDSMWARWESVLVILGGVLVRP
jgi:hypothetical protein